MVNMPTNVNAMNAMNAMLPQAQRTPQNIFMPDGPHGKAKGHEQANPNGQPFQQSSGMSGLMDALNLSPEARGSYTMARAQFEINYQSIRAISGENGSALEATSFSFKASFEFLQAASGEEPIQTEGLDGESLLQKMQDLFSPEKTAGRILDFALAQFAPKGGEDAEGERAEFADRIGAAIQKGFDEAQSILDKLEESIQDGIDKTHELVFGGLDNFVKNGVPEDHADRSERIREYAAQWQLSVQMQYTSVRASAYNARGEVAETQPTDEARQPFEAQA